MASIINVDEIQGATAAANELVLIAELFALGLGIVLVRTRQSLDAAERAQEQLARHARGLPPTA